jgi:16S rRNA (adenine1518-N6/adenine1519-N6)-dimethyltransferase
VLSENLAGTENVRVIFGDFMKAGDGDIKGLFDGAVDVVANLPYYITTPILFKLFESGLDMNGVTVMLQKEVAERLTAKAGTKEYGVLTVMLGYRSDIKITRTVGRAMFYPAPDVDSAVVKITPDNKKPCAKDERVFFRLVRAAFAMRRKTLVNNIIAAFPLSRSETEQILAEAGLSPTVRGECLTVTELIRLSDLIGGQQAKK